MKAISAQTEQELKRVAKTVFLSAELRYILNII